MILLMSENICRLTLRSSVLYKSRRVFQSATLIVNNFSDS